MIKIIDKIIKINQQKNKSKSKNRNNKIVGKIEENIYIQNLIKIIKIVNISILIQFLIQIQYL